MVLDSVVFKVFTDLQDDDNDEDHGGETADDDANDEGHGGRHAWTN